MKLVSYITKYHIPSFDLTVNSSQCGSFVAPISLKLVTVLMIKIILHSNFWLMSLCHEIWGLLLSYSIPSPCSVLDIVLAAQTRVL